MLQFIPLFFLFEGIKPKEGAHLPVGIPIESVLESSPYPSFMDESDNIMQELSFVADTRMAESAKLDELPLMSLKTSHFHLGYTAHIMEHVLETTTDPESGTKKSDFKSLDKSLDDFIKIYGVKDFKLDDSLMILDESTFSQLEKSEKNTDELTRKNQTLDSFFEDPEIHPVLKLRYNYQPGEPLKAPNPDPFYDPRFPWFQNNPTHVKGVFNAE